MNAKEARESLIINQPGLINEQARINHYWKSKGYLEALEGDEVKLLIETLKYIHDKFPNGPLVDAIIEETLAKYREAVKL